MGIAGMVVAEDSQNRAVTVRPGCLLDLDLRRQNIYRQAHPIACHAGLGLSGWGWCKSPGI